MAAHGVRLSLRAPNVQDGAPTFDRCLGGQPRASRAFYNAVMDDGVACRPLKRSRLISPATSR
jgi:hypothetical protein